MSNESPKRIERMLRKWARNRRDAAGAGGWPVHPATRRLLQGEVARTFGAARVADRAAGGGRGWLGWSWVRLVLGGGAVAAVLVLAARVWWPQSPAKVGEMAHAPLALAEQVERADQTDRKDRPTPGPTAATVPLDAVKKTDLALVDDLSRAAAAQPTVARKPAPSAAKPTPDASGASADAFAVKLEPKAEGAANAPLPAVAKALGDLPTRADVDNLKAAARTESATVLAKAKDAGEVVSGKKSPVEVEALASARSKLSAEKSVLGAEFEAKGLKKVVPLAALPSPALEYAAPPATMAPRPMAMPSAPSVNAPAGPAPALPVGTAELLNARVANPVVAPGLPAQPVARLGAAAVAQPTAPVATVVTEPASLPELNAPLAQQNFLRVNAASSYRRNLQSPPVPAVLNQFQLQRAGEVVTVVDEDGSVYSGQVLNAEPAVLNQSQLQRAGGQARSLRVNDGAAAAKRELAPTAERLRREQDKSGAEAGGYWFQAIGTNRSVNQRVVFTGNFLPDGAALDDARGVAPGARQSGAAPAAAQGGNAAQKLNFAPANFSQQAGGAGESQGRVNGRVRVGLSNDIQVEAVSPGMQRR